jgi:hypothetical protein
VLFFAPMRPEGENDGRKTEWVPRICICTSPEPSPIAPSSPAPLHHGIPSVCFVPCLNFSRHAATRRVLVVVELVRHGLTAKRASVQRSLGDGTRRDEVVPVSARLLQQASEMTAVNKFAHRRQPVNVQTSHTR